MRISKQIDGYQTKWVKCGNGVELHDPYYSRGVTFAWTGGSKNGKANGHGVATKSKNGVVVHTYTGEYKNGIILLDALN